GKWYWLQYSDSLSPANWQNVVPGPVLANGPVMTAVHPGGAAAAQRFYRLKQVDPLFALKTSGGNVTSLQHSADSFPTEYIAGGGKLGDILIKYRQTGTNWQSARTSTLAGIASSTNYTTPDATRYVGRYLITSGLSGTLVLENIFTFE